MFDGLEVAELGAEVCWRSESHNHGQRCLGQF